MNQPIENKSVKPTLPLHILRDVQNFITDNHVSDTIDDMSAESLLDAYLVWNGIVGYTRTILEAVDAIREFVGQHVCTCTDYRTQPALNCPVHSTVHEEVR